MEQNRTPAAIEPDDGNVKMPPVRKDIKSHQRKHTKPAGRKAKRG
jgi:hypothetical protein